MTPSLLQRDLPVKIFLVMGSSIALVLASSLMMGPLIVDIAADFNTSVSKTGQFASATFIAWAIGAPLTGPISDSYGRRPIALIGVGLVGTGLLGCSLSINYEMMFVFRLLTGFGSAMILPNSAAVVADLVSPQTRGKYIGRLTGIGTIATAMGAPIAAMLINFGTWRTSFLAFGTIALLVWILLWIWFPRLHSTNSNSLTLIGRYREAGSNPTLWYVLISNVSQRTVYFAMLSYLAAYLIQDYGQNSGDTALPLALVGIGNIVGAFLGSVVATRASRITITMVCFLSQGIAAFVLFYLEISIWLVVGLALIIACCFSITWPVLVSRITETTKSSTATALGISAAGNQLGALGGSAIGGLMLALGGFSMIGIASLVSVMIASLVLKVKVKETAEFTK